MNPPSTFGSCRSRLVQKLAAYAGGAASLLTNANASAGIVYQTFDPPRSLIGELDFDADGRSDFAFNAESGFNTWGCEFTTSGYFYCHTWAGSRRWNTVAGRAQPGNGLLGHGEFGLPLAIALAVDAPIVTSAPTLERAILVQSSSTNSGGTHGCDPGCSGSFGYFFERAYLGVIFTDSVENRHAGWVGIEYDGFLHLSMFGFAYETAPGVPILAGDIGDSHNTPGDTNADGKVDLEDLNNVRNNFGGAGLGDTNEDGVVDLDDLNAVRNNLGAGEANSVPEPPSLLLLAAGAAGLAVLRRKRVFRRGHCDVD